MRLPADELKGRTYCNLALLGQPHNLFVDVVLNWCMSNLVLYKKKNMTLVFEGSLLGFFKHIDK